MATARLDITGDGSGVQAAFEAINGLLAGQEALFGRVGAASAAATRTASTGLDAAAKGAQAAAEAAGDLQDTLDDVENSATAVGSAFSLIAGGPVAALRGAVSVVSTLADKFGEFQASSIAVFQDNVESVNAWERSLNAAGLELERLAELNRSLARDSPFSEFELQGAQRSFAPVFGSQSGVEGATQLAADLSISTNQSLDTVAQALADFQRSSEAGDELLDLGLRADEIDALAEVARLQEILPDLEASLAEFQREGVSGPEGLDELRALRAELAQARNVQGRDVRGEVFDILRERSAGAAGEAADRDPFQALGGEFERFQFNFGQSLVEASLPIAQAQADALLRINDALESGSSFGDVLTELPGAISAIFEGSQFQDDLFNFLDALKGIFIGAADIFFEVGGEVARLIGLQAEDAIVKALRPLGEALGIKGIGEVESRLEANNRSQEETALRGLRALDAARDQGNELADAAIKEIAFIRQAEGPDAARRLSNQFANTLLGSDFQDPGDISAFQTDGIARAVGRLGGAVGRASSSATNLQTSALNFGADATEVAAARTQPAASDPAAQQVGIFGAIQTGIGRLVQLQTQATYAPREATL